MSYQQRGEFRVPNVFYVTARFEQGRIGLVEDAAEVALALPPANGLVAVVDGGLVVFTNQPQGEVHFRVLVHGEPPSDAAVRVYEDVVEVSYRAVRGLADVVTLSTSEPVAARAVTFPGPGSVRARVQAWGRTSARSELAEQYVLELWQAPEAPERVLRSAAEIGAARIAGPEQAYRWIEQSALEAAACLTFVPGATTEQVLEAFNADPANSTAWSDRHDTFPDLTPFIGLIPVPGGVIAVEDNGWTGSEPSILQALSTPGRQVASAFWNVNALRCLGFARDGVLLASAEWGLEAIPVNLDPDVTNAVAGIDYQDVHASTAKDILAASRFTGLTLAPEDLEAPEAGGRAYRIRQRTANS